MAQVDEFEVFIEECRELGLADVKALEAAWEEAAAFLPPDADAAGFRRRMVDMMAAGVRYARLQEQLEGENHG